MVGHCTASSRLFPFSMLAVSVWLLDRGSCLTQVLGRHSTHVTRLIPAVLGCKWPSPPGFNPLLKGWVYRLAPLGEFRRGSKLFWNHLASVDFDHTPGPTRLVLYWSVWSDERQIPSKSFVEFDFRVWHDIAQRLLARFLSSCWPCLLGY